jgi:hypothetical protein
MAGASADTVVVGSNQTISGSSGRSRCDGGPAFERLVPWWPLLPDAAVRSGLSAAFTRDVQTSEQISDGGLTREILSGCLLCAVVSCSGETLTQG